jgi:hypothetical protein
LAMFLFIISYPRCLLLIFIIHLEGEFWSLELSLVFN